MFDYYLSLSKKIKDLPIEDPNVSYSLFKNGNVKIILFKKGNVLHRDKDPALYMFYDNGKIKKMLFYKNGHCYNDNRTGFDDYKHFSSISFYKNGNLKDVAYTNEKGESHGNPGLVSYYEDYLFNTKSMKTYKNGLLESIDSKPSSNLFYKSGKIAERMYHKKGKLHRIDGPAIEVYDEKGKIKSEKWYKNGIKQ